MLQIKNPQAIIKTLSVLCLAMNALMPLLARVLVTQSYCFPTKRFLESDCKDPVTQLLLNFFGPVKFWRVEAYVGDAIQSLSRGRMIEGFTTIAEILPTFISLGFALYAVLFIAKSVFTHKSPLQAGSNAAN